MSQIYKSVASTPSVPTTFDADTGSATPAANVINILGIDSTTNNENGITTTASGNTVNVVLTNRLQGTGSTSGAVDDDIITFNLGATPGTYQLQIDIVGFESSTPAGAGYQIIAAARTTGAAAFVIGSPDFTVNEDAALTTADADVIASGNTIIVRVTGVALLNINWNAVATYVFIG